MLPCNGGCCTVHMFNGGMCLPCAVKAFDTFAAVRTAVKQALVPRCGTGNTCVRFCIRLLQVTIGRYRALQHDLPSLSINAASMIMCTCPWPIISMHSILTIVHMLQKDS